jgi:hypothetical protein
MAFIDATCSSTAVFMIHTRRPSVVASLLVGLTLVDSTCGDNIHRFAREQISYFPTFADFSKELEYQREVKAFAKPSREPRVRNLDQVLDRRPKLAVLPRSNCQ